MPSRRSTSRSRARFDHSHSPTFDALLIVPLVEFVPSLGAVVSTTPLAVLPLAPSTTALTVDERVDQIIDNMSVDHLVDQMTQITIITTVTLNETKAAEDATFKIGSFLSSPFYPSKIQGKIGWTAAEWRKVMARIQEISKKENGGHPISYVVDWVYGASYVQNATLFGQQFSAGASFNFEFVRQMAEINAKDTAASGVTWMLDSQM